MSNTGIRELAKRAYLGTPPRLNLALQLSQAAVGRGLRHPGAPLRLHLGCGSQHLAGFVNIDMKPTRATDYVWNLDRGLPCPDDSAERIETYHVIEHIPHPRVRDVVAEWFRVLAVGGVLVVECPDFDEDVRRYLAGDEEHMLGSIYGWQRYDGDTHFYGYNVQRLTELLTSVGFRKIEEHPAQDYHAQAEPCLRMEATK